MVLSSESPKFLLLLAVLSISGLVLLGYQAGIVGNVVESSSPACCTLEEYRSGPTGIIQLGAETSTNACSSRETSLQCCARVASETGSRMRVLGARDGNCVPPEVSYPTAPPVGGYSICCSTEMWRHSPSGYAQGEAQTNTEYCQSFESPNQCCVRAARYKSDVQFKLLGTTLGPCGSSLPVRAFPMWIPG